MWDKVCKKNFKKTPIRPTSHGDFSEQARVSNLVSTPKVSLGIDLSNPYNQDLKGSPRCCADFGWNYPIKSPLRIENFC